MSPAICRYIPVLLVAAVLSPNALAQQPRERLDCEGISTEFETPVLSDYCAKDQHENECYNRWRKRYSEVEEHNRMVRQCKSRSGGGSSSPAARNTPSPQTPSAQKPSTQTSPSQPSAVQRALQRQQTQAEGADKANAKHKAEAEKFLQNSREERSELDEIRAREEEVRRNQERIRKQIEAEYIPPGWIDCGCPARHAHFGKFVRGVLYHSPQSPLCP